ncbi:uncharacterized protein FOMMEDRAFT_129830 [Fomitiporia mediterranea MF3/22]|uniref:uncharacterized protein n=1 Tax=Fomitiporia mediterranea (strain MF3/22) TaxID=694068 RepID=UPI0004408137|nr:uncharacterized protein FOMMEDRAFT_129830 [Fomitiporia mediterranea MF3/22]EJC97931.1 hypothetical protein FOMMEDRAFT_129830 [Fomitiporia mediterranea MF3/22]
MGTGAITILFHSFPYGTNNLALQSVALAFLILNLIFFTVITTLTILRYVLFRGMWMAMLRHPTQSQFLGCAPMGFATVIISATGIVHEYFNWGGRAFVYVLWALWWADVVVAVAIFFGQLHIMFTRQTHDLSRMTMVWLLPVVTIIVVASTGGVVAQALIPIALSSPSPFIASHIYLTLAICMMLVTMGITFALAVITIYLLRLAVYKLPGGLSIFSVFLPLGPLGQAGFCFLILGQVSSKVFPVPYLPVSNTSGSDASNINVFTNVNSSYVIYAVAWLISFTLWCLATAWVTFGFGALGDVLVLMREWKRLPFKVTFWGMIFPNGVYANLTIQLSNTLDSHILRVWGSIYAVWTLLLWLFAVLNTMRTLKNGSIYEELCVAVEREHGGDGRGSAETRSEETVKRQSGSVRMELEEEMDRDVCP